MYKTGLDTDISLPKVEEGTNILVVGGAFTHKRDLLIQMSTQAFVDEEALVFVSSSAPASKLREEFEKRSEVTESRLGVVDISSHESQDTNWSSYLNSPGDLTGIDINIKNFLRDLVSEDVNGYRVVIEDVTTLLMYSDFEVLYKFLYQISQRNKQNNGLGIIGLNPSMLADDQRNTVSEIFDVMIETKREEDIPYVRVLSNNNSSTGSSGEWQRLD